MPQPSRRDLTSPAWVLQPAGYWCSAGVAIDCAKDTYNEQTGQSNQGACVACPEFSESPPASISLGDCQCERNFYNEISNGTDVSCKLCPIGTACDLAGLTLASLPLVKGFWRTSNASSGILRCPDAAQNDTACIGGPGPELCKPWTTGPCAPLPAAWPVCAMPNKCLWRAADCKLVAPAHARTFHTPVCCREQA